MIRWVRLLLPKDPQSPRQADFLGLEPTLMAWSLCQDPPPGAGVGFSDSSPGPPPCPSLGEEHMAGSTPARRPSLGQSQVSLLNALVLLINFLGPVKFDRLRKVSGRFPSLLFPNHWNRPMINLPWNVRLSSTSGDFCGGSVAEATRATLGHGAVLARAKEELSLKTKNDKYWRV